MNPRAGIGILVCGIGILSAQAQSERKDSLKHEKEGEIYINQEAVKSIKFYFMNQPEVPKPKPRMDETKPWLEFRKDLPSNLTDTTKIRKKKYIRIRPYSIWGYDNAHWSASTQEDTLTMHFKLDLEKINPLPGMGHGYRVLPAGMDQTVTPSNNPLTGFNADKLLFENFTKRGRAIKRNRKKAKAWKTYKDYVPTKEDSLKLYGNKKRIPKDTLTITVDSMKNHFMNTK